jgi:hypothetical protein
MSKAPDLRSDPPQNRPGRGRARRGYDSAGQGTSGRSRQAGPGVQPADPVAYALRRQWNEWDKHPDAKEAIGRIAGVVSAHLHLARTSASPLTTATTGKFGS